MNDATHELDSEPLAAAVKKPTWLSRLSRVTTSGRLIPEIDGFRFIAIMGVLTFHDFGHVLQRNGFVTAASPTATKTVTGLDYLLSQVIGCGAIGVQLFFVISGFILALPFAEHHLLGAKKPVLRAYYWRRVTRLEPPYIIVMTLWAFLIVLYKDITLSESLKHLAASLLYVHNQVYGTGSVINNIAWSLEVEIQFYLLAPLLTFLFVIRSKIARRLVLLALILTFSIINNTIAPDTYRYQASILNAIQYFLTGFLLADVYLLNAAFLRVKHLVWDALALAAWVVMIVTLSRGDGMWGSETFHLPLCMLVIYLAGFKGPLLNRFLRLPFIYLIGGMCYTIYLYHGHFVSALAIITHRLYIQSLPVWVNYPVHLAIHLALILPVCILLFVLIERPCMKRDWPQQLWRKLTGKPRPQMP